MAYLVNITNQFLSSKYLFDLNISVLINLILLCDQIEKNLGFDVKPSSTLSICLCLTLNIHGC